MKFLVRRIGTSDLYETFTSKPDADAYVNRTPECAMCDKPLETERMIANLRGHEFEIGTADMYVTAVHFGRCTLTLMDVVADNRGL